MSKSEPQLGHQGRVHTRKPWEWRCPKGHVTLIVRREKGHVDCESCGHVKYKRSELKHASTFDSKPEWYDG